jgi:four helix bundle protein
MSLQNFRAFQMAKELYKETKKLRLTLNERDQLDRAALSIATNLAEGSGKTGKDRSRYFAIAMGSLREVQGLLEITGQRRELVLLAECLGGRTYRLQRNPGKGP